MASMTQMFNLMRLIDYGAGDDVVEAAWQCWQALPEATQNNMIVRGGADGRRARLWFAAWSGGLDLAMDHIEALEAQQPALDGTS